MFSLADPPAVQLDQVTMHCTVYICRDIFPLPPLQVSFWLTFLQSRIPPVEPLGDCGRSHRAASVVLVG